MLPARPVESLPLTCPNCGADMRIVAFATEAASVKRIRYHIGEPSTPPRIAPARGPPQWDADDSGAAFLDAEGFSGDPLAQQESECEFDQRAALRAALLRLRLSLLPVS